MENILYTVIFLSLTNCISNSSADSPEVLSDLANTIWINQPLPEFPECIDTLVLLDRQYGYEYSCEHNFSDSIAFRIMNDTLYVDKYDYLFEVYTDQKGIVSRYKLILVKGNLRIVDIKHRYGARFASVKKETLANKDYKKLD